MAATACDCDFGAQYAQNAHPAFRDLERFVLGCDYGGTSWTTRRQADASGRSLGLRRGVRMLELGAGSGWPAVYLARRSGCELTLLDLPLNALHMARQRATGEGLGDAVRAVCASGAQLPFGDGTFEALGHSDVLCCLEEKQQMLGECRRVARRGAPMLFYVILPAAGLGEADHAAAVEAGPSFVEAAADYGAMLAAADWRVRERKPVSREYLETLRRMVDGLETRAAVFETVMAPGEFRETLRRRRGQACAVERGILVREMYLAEAV